MENEGLRTVRGGDVHNCPMQNCTYMQSCLRGGVGMLPVLLLRLGEKRGPDKYLDKKLTLTLPLHMPTVMKSGTFRFHFYSDEGNEPPHIHVATPDGECKFWLDPVRLSRNRGVAPEEIRQIERIVFEKEDFLKEKFNAYFSRSK